MSSVRQFAERGGLCGPAAKVIDMNDYHSFLASKAQYGEASGFEPVWMPEFLYPYRS